jgi:hypothetical protein
VPTQTPEVHTVDAGLGALVVQARSQTSAPAHVEIPVYLRDGVADLQISVTVVGLNKFTRTSGAGEGNWSCLAVTPMAGAGKTAVVRCTLPNADPRDPLTLGLELGYAGDGSVRAVLEVLEPAVDGDASDNTASADLPPRQG